MELLQYWRVIQKRLWLIALLLIAGGVVSGFAGWREQPEYQSTALLVLNPAVPPGYIYLVQSQVASSLADSYSALMHSQSFGEQVATELNHAFTAGEVVGGISTQLKANTLFFNVTGRSTSALRAQQLVNGVIKVFIAANADQQKKASNQGEGSIKNDMQQRLQGKITYLADLNKSYEEQIRTLEAQPSGKERNDQLFQLRGQLITLQEAETQVITALAGVDSSTAPTNTAVVIDAAPLGYPLPSRWPANVLATILGAAVLGIALSFVFDYLDYTVRSPEYLEQVMGLTPMAVVGLVGQHTAASYGRRRAGSGKRLPGQSATLLGGWAGRLAGHKLVTLEFPKSPDSESFRVLRTNIQFFSLGKPIRSLVVTSAGPGEGKSFTAANLAIVMAQAGKRVILVDTDLRRPSLHKLFDMPNTVGFTNLVLNNMEDRGGIIQQVAEVPNLLLVTSGPLPPNPSELLDSPQALHVIQGLAQAADLVIYDTPPATAVTDPAIMATRVDGVVLVINAGVTRRDMVERVRKILHNVGVKSLIPVLNQVKTNDLRGYYYYNTYGNTLEGPAAITNGNGHSNGHGNGHHANGATTPATAVEDILFPPQGK